LVRKESYNLPTIKDYKMHKTSVELKALPSGIYVENIWLKEKYKEIFILLPVNLELFIKRNDLSVKNELKLVRDNGKILPKENLEFYEFVNNKFQKVILQ
jgi:hypothetical protein